MRIHQDRTMPQLQSRHKVRIGVLTDLSGPYRDVNGPTSVFCVRQAVREFTGARVMKVEVLAADHQNEPDLGVAIARQWFDREGVDAIVNLPNSALALAVSSICRDKNKVMLATSPATTELTGKQCSPNTVQWGDGHLDGDQIDLSQSAQIW